MLAAPVASVLAKPSLRARFESLRAADYCVQELMQRSRAAVRTRVTLVALAQRSVLFGCSMTLWGPVGLTDDSPYLMCLQGVG